MFATSGLQRNVVMFALPRTSVRAALSPTNVSCAAKEGAKVFPRFSDVCRGSVRLPRRRRTLKRDEHGARFFLHQEMRRLACVPTKDENRDLESGASIRENGTTDDLADSAAIPPD
jgi:hypothetical protein